MALGFEASFILWLQQFVTSSAWLVGLAVFLARWLILANILVAFWLFTTGRKKLRHSIEEAAWSVIFALMITTCIAFLVQRMRPYFAFSDIALLIPPPFNSSFPSGHTAAAIAMATAFFLADRRAGWASLGIAVLVMLGRVAVGVHYPSDLLGGIIVGVVSVLFVRTVHDQLLRPDIKKSAQTHRHR
jgi:undecaprenyl-diphosphatase